MTDHPNSTSKLSENVWLALLPLAATYLAFLFQSSYFGYFGVPASMIEVDIPKVIFSMAAIIVAGVLFIAMFAFVADLLHSKNPIIRIVGRGLTSVVIFLPFILAATDTFTSKQLATYGTLFSLTWLVNFIPPAQKAGETKSYLERLRKQEDENDHALKSKPKNIKQAVGNSVFGPFSLALFGSIYVLMLGTYCATKLGGNTYLKSNLDALYVGKVGGSYVFTLVDPKANTFSDHILLLDSSAPIELVRKKRTATRAK